LIPVIFNFSTASENVNVPSGYGSWDFQNYPTLLTRGASGGNSKYGIKLNYRITNIGNYDHVNIIRIKWNEWIDGGSISPIPSAQYFKVQHSLSAGEISVRTFTDQKSVVWSDMTPADETQVLSSIQCAKGIRYYDNKLILMNIKYASMDLSKLNVVVPTLFNENQFSYIHNMGVLGHADPKNTTYYKGFKGGEKYGFGILAKDNEGERTFVLPINDHITGENLFSFPNNREALNTNSLLASVTRGKGVANAARIDSYNNNNVGVTNEIISLDNGTSVYDAGYTAGEKTSLSIDSTEISISKNAFKPIHPIRQDDDNEQGHNRRVLENEFLGFNLQNSVSANHRVFAPEIYAKGFGITGVQNLPNWVKSFSIVRTKPVGRVIAQGIGVYAFDRSSNNGDKFVNKIWFYSQDVDALGINDNVEGSIKLQFVSPLGFVTEEYGASLDHVIDMVAYTRIAHNNNDTNPGLQKTNSAGSLVNDYYTEFGSWRYAESLESNNTFADSGHVNGNKIFDIATGGVVQKTSGRYTYYEITLNENIYKYPSCTHGTSTVNDVAIQRFHEPFYLVNIINDGATLPQDQMTTYYETGHQQKLESIIGSGTNAPITLPLCDERYDDCMPSDYAVDKAYTDTFIYIRDKNTGAEQRWLNATYKSSTDKDQIISDLNSSGVHTILHTALSPNPYSSGQDIDIYGVYGSQWSDWTALSDTNGRDAKIVFNNNIYDSGGTQLLPQYCIPNANTYIIVKYDDRFPLKVFGGDTIISEDTTCFNDGQTSNTGGGQSGELTLNEPFPYWGFEFNNLYRRVWRAWKDPSDTNYLESNHATNGNKYNMGYVRQLAVNFFHETQVHMPYEFNKENSYSAYTFRRSFPRLHYIMRPSEWDSNLKNNFDGYSGGLSNTYEESEYPFGSNGGGYGLEENYWGYGGFICNNILQPSNKLGAYDNQDYQSFNNYMPPVSKPAVGWKEIVNYCTRIIWSQQRNIAQQDVPNLKTFLSDCFYDIEDAYGEIKYAFSANTGSGENLYAFTNNGIAILLTQKIMTQDTTGNLIAYIRSTDAYITGRQWIRTDVGMNDEMWRSAAEWAKTIFWANNESAFMMFDNKVTDIGRLGYRKRLFYDGLQKVLPNYGSVVSAVYNRNNNEYWLNIEKRGTPIHEVDRNTTILNFWWFSKVISAGNYVVSNGNWVDIKDGVGLPSMYVVLPDDFVAGNTFTITNSTSAAFDVKYHISGFYFNIIDTLNVGETAVYQIQSDGITWVNLNIDVNTHEMFVAYIDNEEIGWNGTFSLNYEKMICLDNDVYGIRDGKIYQTQIGYIINDVVLDSSVTGVCNAEVTNDKEFIAFMAATENKPTSVDFANSLIALPECTLSYNLPTPANSFYLKEYGQNRWTNKIPRKHLTNNNRSQGRILIFKITHTAAENFVVISSVIEYKNLKLQL
jgi:hypothetical protein